MSANRLNPFLSLALLPLMGCLPLAAEAAEIDGDGGITLRISYVNSDPSSASPLRFDAQVTELSMNVCGDAKQARNQAGAGGSAGSCSVKTGGTTCTGEEKLQGDVQQLADYIYNSTHGKHHLKKAIVADQGRKNFNADVLWDLANGSAHSALGGWQDNNAKVYLYNAARWCIHDLLHHELGHYLYQLPDRYGGAEGCYPTDGAGGVGGAGEACGAGGAGGVGDVGAEFTVCVRNPDGNTVMGRTFPHRFVNAAEAKMGVVCRWNDCSDVPLELDGGPKKFWLTGESDDPKRAGWRTPDKCETPFGEDEWTMLNMVDVGMKEDPAWVQAAPPVWVPCIEDSDSASPGIAVTLDPTAGAEVREAALYLYHSSSEADYVGAFLYDQSATELFEYAPHEEERAKNGFQAPAFFDLPDTSGSSAGLAVALDKAIDALEGAHPGECGPGGSMIILMSNGKQAQVDAVWGQVNRAAQLGITIHALAFETEDDASTPEIEDDAATMQDIARFSSGSVTLVSDPSDPAELKIDMVRAFNTLRGYTQIYSYKGAVDVPSDLPIEAETQPPPEVTKIAGEITGLSGSFEVAAGTRDILFYVFPKKGNAADFKIELKREGSSVPLEEAFATLAMRGRFTGVRASSVEPGPWEFKLMPVGNSLPAQDSIEIVAFARNPLLHAYAYREEYKHPQYEFDGRTDSGIQAVVRYKYPLIGARAIARVYDGPRLLATSYRLRDGGKEAFDPRTEDGIYSTRTDFFARLTKSLAGQFGRTDRRKLRVEVEFVVSRSSFPADANYEPDSNLKSLARDYGDLIKRTRARSFSVYATTMVHLKPIVMEQPKVVIKKKPNPMGQRGQFVVTVMNARPLRSQLRVSLEDASARILNAYPVDGPELGVDVVIFYELAPSAGGGNRDLRLQFGKTILGPLEIPFAAN